MHWAGHTCARPANGVTMTMLGDIPTTVLYTAGAIALLCLLIGFKARSVTVSAVGAVLAALVISAITER